MHRKNHSMYEVWDYPRFQGTTGGFWNVSPANMFHVYTPSVLMLTITNLQVPSHSPFQHTPHHLHTLPVAEACLQTSNVHAPLTGHNCTRTHSRYTQPQQPMTAMYTPVFTDYALSCVWMGTPYVCTPWVYLQITISVAYSYKPTLPTVYQQVDL